MRFNIIMYIYLSLIIKKNIINKFHSIYKFNNTYTNRANIYYLIYKDVVIIK